MISLHTRTGSAVRSSVRGIGGWTRILLAATLAALLALGLASLSLSSDQAILKLLYELSPMLGLAPL